MKLSLLILWFILLPMTTIAIVLPLSKNIELDSLSKSKVFLFLLLWPLTLIIHGQRFPEYVTQWKNELSSGSIKPWQTILLFFVAPVVLFGLLEGSGDLGTFWFTLVVLLGCVGNLLLHIQIVKFLGII